MQQIKDKKKVEGCMAFKKPLKIEASALMHFGWRKT